MGVSKVTGSIEVRSENPVAAQVGSMQYLVGFGLTRWHFVEQDLTMIYLLLCCPANVPVDGPLTAFENIQTTEGKINLLQKILAQVLYQNEFVDFRREAKKKLVRIQKINKKRNKIAHGMTNTLVEEGQETAYFLPFYNLLSHFRENSLTKRGFLTDIVKRQEKWDLRKLHDVVEELEEGPLLSKKLLDDLNTLYVVHRNILEDAGRMTLESSLPFKSDER